MRTICKFCNGRLVTSKSSRRNFNTTTELAPAHTDVASALNVSALNFGIAGGSFVGNAVMSYAGLQMLPLVGAVIGGVALLVVVLLRRIN